MKRDAIDLSSFSQPEIDGILSRALALKGGADPADFRGKTLGSIYFNPSLRTRASFDVACAKLGMTPVTVEPGKGAWSVETAEGVVMDSDKAEHVKELARVMGSYVDVLGVRAFPTMNDFEADRSQDLLPLFSREAACPVVSLESPLAHPCQELADMLTLRERGLHKPGTPFLLTWAYHPRALPQAVPRSALHAAAAFGLSVTLAFPEGYDLEPAFQDEMADLAASRGGSLRIEHDVDAAFSGQRAVYAKSWSPMARYGEGAPSSLRNWQVTEERMESSDSAIFMHCLPVRRNVVVADGVLDSPASVVTEQAVNRIWGQTALLENLLQGGTP